MAKKLVTPNDQKVPRGVRRSTHWPLVRAQHLKKNPRCAACGGTKKVEVHHKLPFHLHPDLELDPKNLITLCEAKEDGVNCHLLFGHLGSFKSFNRNVEADARDWQQKMTNRPKGTVAI